MFFVFYIRRFVLSFWWCLIVSHVPVVLQQSAMVLVPVHLQFDSNEKKYSEIVSGHLKSLSAT